MIFQTIALVIALWTNVGQSASAPSVDVTGAWSVSFTIGERQGSGLAILSQDDGKITGMLGPAETDMFPVEGTVSGNTVTIIARPRTGRSTAFAKCDVAVDGDRMSGTVDTDRGTIEFVKRKRTGG